jgi:hypothetical protein
VGRHTVRTVEELDPTSTIATADTLTLLTAHHSRLGDVLSLIVGNDGHAAAISPGDTVTMEFSALSVVPGRVRDFFLVSNGVYATLDAPGSASTVVWRNALGSAHPNPSVGLVAFHLTAAGGPVSVRIYDVTGRLVRSLVDGALPAGPRDLTWNLKGEQGQRVSSGVYFCRMTAGDWKAQRKMVVLTP